MQASYPFFVEARRSRYTLAGLSGSPEIHYSVSIWLVLVDRLKDVLFGYNLAGPSGSPFNQGKPHAKTNAYLHTYIHTFIHTYLHACIHTYLHA